MLNELEIEQKLVLKLKDIGYTVREDIHNRKDLELNFRQKFEALNKVKLTNNEFDRLLEEITTPDVFQASKLLRQINTLEREDGTPLHYSLLNLKDWCKNDFEVIHQLRMNTRYSFQRYDVIILINGLPLVQIELKTLEISPRRAIQQIVDYKKDSDNGYINSLLCFMQLFIVSNRTNTYYFANNNKEYFQFHADEQFLPVYQWADENNRKITHIDEFSEKFLGKCALAEMISKYMVLVETEKKLLIMRPYQIYAVQAIMDCIHKNNGNGYIWHTTGSGKTLTSFKASVLMKENPDIHKCVFVVDRKDLDRQTRDEFNRFQPGCVEENTNTQTLVRRLLSENYADKVIVTTIQKLGLALDARNEEYRRQLQSLQNKRMVFIFDECHRSQFGENHKAIREFFPHAQLFGFTGTPIFEENASYKQIESNLASFVTTRDVFEKQLHAYTITHAIDDKNVLRFHIDYYKPEKENLSFNSNEHKLSVVQTILKKHDTASSYRRFNALFATQSIDDAIAYYHLFKQLQQEKKSEDSEYEPLNIACIFSPPANGNKDIAQLQEDLMQEKEDLKVEPDRKKEALENIMQDYNLQYGTNYSIADFDLYYQDIQKRIKDHRFSDKDFSHKNKVDIVIVVDMLLTGFDSKYLNTLYVDKNLRYHGLIQAFSRTNRVLNDSKPYGNILDFRCQQEQVDKAIALFSGENTQKPKEIWLVEPAEKVIQKYEQAVNGMQKWMTDSYIVAEPEAVYNLRGDASKIEFINRFKEVQRIYTQLEQYTDLTEEQKQKIESLLPEEKLRSFRASYLEIASEIKEIQETKGSQAPADIQQTDLELVLFASALIDYDYIIKLISRFTQQSPKKIKLSRDQLIGILGSTANLMEEKEVLEEYIHTLEVGKPLDELSIHQGYQQFKAKKMEKTLTTLAEKYHITIENLKHFIQDITTRLIFDADKLSELLYSEEFSWKERKQREENFVKDIIPLLRKLSEGREISGIKVYEN